MLARGCDRDAMRNRRVRAEHQEAVSRRLAQLSEELAAARAPVPATPTSPAPPAPAAPAGPVVPAIVPPVAAWWVSPHEEQDPEAWQSPDPLEPAARGEVLAHYDRPSLERELMVAPQPWRARAPGRHVSQRADPPRAVARGRLVDLLPETLRGRVRLGSGALTVVAVLVACAVVLTAWRVVRADPQTPTLPVAAPASGDLVEVPGGGGGDDPVGAPTAAEAPVGTDPAAVTTQLAAQGGTSEVTVDVAGKVRRPGIVVLPAGSRVVDALDQAGGARRGVDTTALNLARLLVDGEQLLVGVDAPAVVPPAPGAIAPGTPGAPGAPGALVDLNLATQPELEELPEVGPVTAAAIIAWREQNGGFTAVAELLEVDGIGDATLAQLTPLVTV